MNRPPYQINSRIIRQVAAISELLGALQTAHLDRPAKDLRKANKIKTIHSSLGIEGNTLTLDQVTAIIDNQRVMGPVKDIQEVSNAISVYDQLDSFNAFSESSFLNAHAMMMNQLLNLPGRYRSKNVGIVEKETVRHLAPPPRQIPSLMHALFDYITHSDELILIKSCVFHYELEFIHPFLDGNGRMGRLWQTVLLMTAHPLYEFIPFETKIRLHQEEYYKALSTSDTEGESTAFITFMLSVIEAALRESYQGDHARMTSDDRIRYFMSKGFTSFSRKDYLSMFKNISSATASRDLRAGVKRGLLLKTGERNQTIYHVRSEKG